jgi:hypothetical protein
VLLVPIAAPLMIAPVPQRFNPESRMMFGKKLKISTHSENICEILAVIV